MIENRFDVLKRKSSIHLIAALSAVITFLVYLPALRNEFVNWDDGNYIYENSFIRSIDANFFEWAFLHFYAANWHPLTWFSHAVDYAIWGLNPVGHHLTSIILHAVNTFLVVLLVVKLMALRNRKSDPSDTSDLSDMSEKTRSRFTVIAAATTGLLFGLHPLHVESVAWVSERKDLLCALFFLLGILSYITYVSCRTYKTYLLSLGFFILALLSKPMAVTFPVVLLILDWYPLKRIQSGKMPGSVIMEKLPFVALSLVSSIITIYAQSSGKAIVPLEVMPFSLRIVVSIKALASYLAKMIYPLELNPYYPYPRSASFLSLQYLLPLLLVIGITTACITLAKRHKLWLTIWGYYVIMLLPVLGIVQVGNQAMADRYTYLPGLGPFFIAGLGIALLYEKAFIKWKSTIKAVVVIATAVLLIGMSYKTVGQISIWKNPFVLWSYNIDKSSQRTPLAYYNRGLYYGQRGLLDEAIADFTEAIAIYPKNGDARQFYSMVYNNRGAAFFLGEQYDWALKDFNNAINLDRANAEAYINRGYIYLKMGNSSLAVSDLQNGCNLGNQNGCKALERLRRGTP